jgi:hypothetical protein
MTNHYLYHLFIGFVGNCMSLITNKLLIILNTSPINVRFFNK